jgi:amino acid transporter
VVLYGAKHGVHLHGSDFTPSYVGFVGLVPILVYNYVGFELPSTAAEEMSDPRKDVPSSIARAGVLAVLLYGAPILGTLLVLPRPRRALLRPRRPRAPVPIGVPLASPGLARHDRY